MGGRGPGNAGRLEGGGAYDTCMLGACCGVAGRYAYSEDVPDEDEEPLTAVAGAAAPAAAADKAVKTDVFSLEDEAEEGKLE